MSVRGVRVLLVVPALASAFLLVGPGAGGSGAAAATRGPSVDIVEVQGVIDAAEAGYVRDTILTSERLGATVILQIDSGGAYGSQAVALGRFIRSASVPVIAWVGPIGARAEGGALWLLYGSSLAAMAPGAGIGPARPFDLATTAGREAPAEVASQSAALEALAPGAEASAAGVRALVGGATLAAGRARALGAVALVAPDIPTLLRVLDGRTVSTVRGPVRLATLNRPGRPVDVRFHEIGLWRRLLHAVGTPSVLLVLLVLGLWGIAFEFTQPGFGMAGMGGLLALSLAGFALTVVPVSWVGIGLILVGTALQGVDVLVRRLAWYTGLGLAVLVAGAVLAWWGVAPGIRPAAWLIALVAVGSFLFFGFAMTVAMRARERIRTTQLGLVGLSGVVRSDLNPEGGVLVKGAMWRARTSNGAIAAGTKIRVRGVDGMVLRVEPEPGDE